MGKKNISTGLLWVVYLLAACTIVTPAPTQPPQLEPNFAFVFKYGSCNTDILDTDAGTFTKDMLIEPAVTVDLRLSDTQMQAVFEKMVAIHFFDYPEVFSIPIPKSGEVGIITPSTRYEIVVWNGEITKTLIWQDEIFDPTTAEADNLRELFQWMINMIQEHPEYKKLPERQAGCI